MKQAASLVIAVSMLAALAAGGVRPAALGTPSAAAALGTPFGAQDHDHAAGGSGVVAPMAGLGSHHHRISTSSPEAQRLFDQGLVLVYGFNHGQAIRLFQRAAELDPTAPMPLWGIALAYGPNINDFEMDRARAGTADAYVKKALAISSPRVEREHAYIEALSKRYSSDPNADLKKLQFDYKDAMGAVARRYPDDLDAQTLYAESLMDLRPWQLWTHDGQPSDVTEEVVSVLESVLKRNPLHPGANHYYIHTMEASPHPEKALASARRLDTLVPAAGHLVHMPAHIYARTGRFVAAINSNAAAAAVDERFIERTHTPRGMYSLMYYNHNVHFESYAASMAGRYARSRKAAEKLAANVGPYITEMPMVEAFVPQQYYVLLRFGKWDDLLTLPPPADPLKLTTIVWHYARSCAYAAKGDLEHARADQQLFLAGAAHMPPETPVGTLNTAGQMFAVAREVLDGRIAAAAGDRTAAIPHYEAAVHAEDALAYDEPPTWYYPVRETLGAALLASGNAINAEQVFREDLKSNPRNGRSLFGLWKSLEAQGKRAAAARARADFERVWAVADVALRLEDL
jgi:tetratricopeptide (TPR) repeat protein